MTVNAYKKLHKKKLRSEVSANSSLIKYGMYALQAVVAGILKPIQVEAVRRVITRETQRVGKIFVRIRFNFPVTKKPLLSRMGKGTGPIKYWIAIVPKGAVIIEYAGLVNRLLLLALKSSCNRLPFKTIVISRYFEKASLNSSNR